MSGPLNTAREALEHISRFKTTSEMDASGVFIDDMEAHWNGIISSARQALATLNATPAEPAKKVRLSELVAGINEGNRHGEFPTPAVGSAAAPSREAIAWEIVDPIAEFGGSPPAWALARADRILALYATPPIPAVLAEREGEA